TKRCLWLDSPWRPALVPIGSAAVPFRPRRDREWRGWRRYAKGRTTVNPRASQSVGRKREHMIVTTAHVGPVLAILFGILILIFPRFLNYFVAIWLILHGLLALGVVR